MHHQDHHHQGPCVGEVLGGLSYSVQLRACVVYCRTFGRTAKSATTAVAKNGSRSVCGGMVANRFGLLVLCFSYWFFSPSEVSTKDLWSIFLQLRSNENEKRVIYFNIRARDIHSSDRERMWPEAHSTYVNSGHWRRRTHARTRTHRHTYTHTHTLTHTHKVSQRYRFESRRGQCIWALFFPSYGQQYLLSFSDTLRSTQRRS